MAPSSILSLASGPQPAHVTTECDRLVKQCVVLARLCSALESISFCQSQLSCTVVKTFEIDVFQHVNVKLNAIFYTICCGESDIVLVVGAPRLRIIYSANRRWIQLLDEHSKTSSPMRAAVAWDNYLPSAEHSRSGTPLRLIYRACEEVRGRVATGYDDVVLWGGSEAVLRSATIPSLPGSFPSFKPIRIVAGTWESCIRQLTVGVFKLLFIIKRPYYYYFNQRAAI